MSFPFFNLPQVVQREVLRKLDILDAFTFSLLSEEALSISKSDHKLTYMQWDFEYEDEVTLYLSETKKKFDSEFAIVIRTRREEEGVTQTDHRGIRIGQHAVVLKKQEGRAKELYVEYDNEAGSDLYELMALIWNHIWSMLRRKDEVKLQVNLSRTDSRLAFRALELSKKFDYVDIIAYDSDVTTDQIRYLFEEISCREMSLHMNLPRNKAHLQPIEHSHIVLDHVEWISFEALLKSKMIELDIRDDCLSDTQLNVILKTWLQGGLPNLQKLEMHILLNGTHSKDAILAGIPWLPFTARGKPDYSEKDRHFYIGNYHSGFDVQRADGMCATLMVDEEIREMNHGVRCMGSVEFLVWKKEYQLLTDEFYE